jgi:hypothetical protein
VVTAGNLFGTDTLSGGSFAFTDKNAGTGKTVTVSGVTINDGNGGANYNLTLADGSNGVITPATLVIRADNKTRLENDSNPRFTATFQGLVGGDSAADILNLIFRTPATKSSPPGNYAIRASGGVNANYSITYQPGELSVTDDPQFPPPVVAGDDTGVPTGGTAVPGIGGPTSAGGSTQVTSEFLSAAILGKSVTAAGESKPLIYIAQAALVDDGSGGIVSSDAQVDDGASGGETTVASSGASDVQGSGAAGGTNESTTGSSQTTPMLSAVPQRSAAASPLPAVPNGTTEAAALASSITTPNGTGSSVPGGSGDTGTASGTQGGSAAEGTQTPNIQLSQRTPQSLAVPQRGAGAAPTPGLPNGTTGTAASSSATTTSNLLGDTETAKSGSTGNAPSAQGGSTADGTTASATAGTATAASSSSAATSSTIGNAQSTPSGSTETAGGDGAGPAFLPNSGTTMVANIGDTAASGTAANAASGAAATAATARGGHSSAGGAAGASTGPGSTITGPAGFAGAALPGAATTGVQDIISSEMRQDAGLSLPDEEIFTEPFDDDPNAASLGNPYSLSNIAKPPYEETRDTEDVIIYNFLLLW